MIRVRLVQMEGFKKRLEGSELASIYVGKGHQVESMVSAKALRLQLPA